MQEFSQYSHVTGHPFVRRLATLGMDRDHFVIFGSGPLLVHGIRSRIGDLDIVARGPAWERACAIGEWTVGRLDGEAMIHFWGGLIEVSRGWVPGEWDIDRLIDGADLIQGFRFAKLENVLLYKRSLKREKDILDILAIEDYFAASGSRSVGDAPAVVPA